MAKSFNFFGSTLICVDFLIKNNRHVERNLLCETKGNVVETSIATDITLC